MSFFIRFHPHRLPVCPKDDCTVFVRAIRFHLRIRQRVQRFLRRMAESVARPHIDNRPTRRIRRVEWPILRPSSCEGGGI